MRIRQLKPERYLFCGLHKYGCRSKTKWSSDVSKWDDASPQLMYDLHMTVWSFTHVTTFIIAFLASYSDQD